jgi:AcrR family transcriptional regulator
VNVAGRQFAEKSMSQSENLAKSSNVRTRDAARTQAEILSVAIGEFAEHGFHGARIGRITQAANCNSRMIYHYFGSKERLYVAVLDRVFEDIRKQEADLRFDEGDPAEKIIELVTFTYDYFLFNGNFRKITRNENLLNGDYIKRSNAIRDMSQPLIVALGKLLDRGFASGVFTRKADPVQLYLSIVALSAHHLNNAATLGVVVGQNLNNPEWQAERRVHAVDTISSLLGVKNR